MIPVSSFSVAARHLRQTLADNITDVDVNHIYITNPKDLDADKSQQSLNLFFYRVEYSGYPADGKLDDPFYARMHCLITALGVDETIGRGPDKDTISAGENDLRLISEVMRVLHQNPIINLSDMGHPLHLQAVFLPLSLDNLNHLWVTQGETDNAYRISVAYEFALAPIPLTIPTLTHPRVGGIGFDVNANIRQPLLPDGGFKPSIASPEVPRVVVNTTQTDWTPQICFLVGNQTLHYVLRLPETTGVNEFDILIAGAEGSSVKLIWEPWEWNYENNKGGWSEEVADTITPAATIPMDDDPSNPLVTNVIDPSAIETRLRQNVRFPFTDPPADGVRRQAMLYAVREVLRPRPQSAPQKIVLRSNPLLVSLYPEEGGA